MVVIVVVYVIVHGVVLLCCVSLFCFARCGVLSCVDFFVARWWVVCIGLFWTSLVCVLRCRREGRDRLKRVVMFK